MYATTKDFGKMTKPSNQLETKKAASQEQENDVETCDEESAASSSKEFISQAVTNNTSQPIGPQKSFDLAQPAKNVQDDEIEPVGEIEKEQDHNASNSTESSDEEEIAISDPQYHAKQIARTFRERCRKQAKQQMSTMIVSDKVAFKDPQNLSEFSSAIYKSMLSEENIHLI
jgi:hypothetical protein